MILRFVLEGCVDIGLSAMISVVLVSSRKVVIMLAHNFILFLDVERDMVKSNGECYDSVCFHQPAHLAASPHIPD